MAVTYGFYNSVAQDRLYNSIQLSRLFSSIIADGVLGAVGEAFHVAAGTGLQVTVDTGRAWFHNSWTDNDSILTLSLAAAHPTLPRIDRVIIEMDSSNGVRANEIKILQGTPATNPVGPTLTHTEEVNQYTFANIHVAAGATQITQGNIVNKIGTSECPLVTGILQTMTIDNIVAQWEAQFNFWFDTLQDQLDENQAANLQGQITESNNTLIEEIVSTGTADEFVFDNIPGGFNMLRITGMLKGTATSGLRRQAPVVRFNGDSGANYAYIIPDTGVWSGWGSNTSLNVGPIVNSFAADAGFFTNIRLEVPFYANSSMLKMNLWTELYGDAALYPGLPPYTYMINRNIWRSTSPITSVSISGTYVATLSRLKLFGCAF